jgi:Cof subfamily protein (haloacid dehalogenase superfamily)
MSGVLPVPVRGVVTDLDGTIVQPGRSVSNATAAAARALRQAGIPLVVATARTPAGLSVIGPMLADVTFAVCCSGSIGYVPATREPRWRHRLGTDVLSDLAELLAEVLPEARFGAYDGRLWIVCPGYLELRAWRPVGPVQVAPREQVCEVDASALAICHPARSAAEVAAVLEATGVLRGRATMCYGSDDTLDVVPHGVDKGTGVIRALAELTVAPADVVGFGDAMSDLAMFGVVGHRVAVANAHPDVLAAADEVAAAVTDDGVARWLSALS